MIDYRVEIAPEVADIIRQLPPDLKRSVKEALRALSRNPNSGDPLRRELEGLWKYRVRRYRVIYSVDRDHRLIRVPAVGSRAGIYELAAARLGGAPKRKR